MRPLAIVFALFAVCLAALPAVAGDCNLGLSGYGGSQAIVVGSGYGGGYGSQAFVVGGHSQRIVQFRQPVVVQQQFGHRQAVVVQRFNNGHSFNRQQVIVGGHNRQQVIIQQNRGLFGTGLFGGRSRVIIGR